MCAGLCVCVCVCACVCVCVSARAHTHTCTRAGVCVLIFNFSLFQHSSCMETNIILRDAFEKLMKGPAVCRQVHERLAFSEHSPVFHSVSREIFLFTG